MKSKPKFEYSRNEEGVMTLTLYAPKEQLKFALSPDMPEEQKERIGTLWHRSYIKSIINEVKRNELLSKGQKAKEIANLRRFISKRKLKEIKQKANKEQNSIIDFKLIDPYK